MPVVATYGSIAVSPPPLGTEDDGFVVENEWHLQLFGCFQDLGLCCDSVLCYTCMMGRIYATEVQGRTGEMSVGFTAMWCGAYCFRIAACVPMGLLYSPMGSVYASLALTFSAIGASVQIGYAWLLRERIRTQHQINGDACEDCLVASACAPCAARQHHRELAVHGRDPGTLTLLSSENVDALLY
eukprot:gene20379-31357_t